jgi:hypothetical protein
VPSEPRRKAGYGIIQRGFRLRLTGVRGSEWPALNKRYFFHIVGHGSTFEDQNGAVLSGPEAALQQAADIAVELVQNDTELQGSMVYVVDDNGREVARVPIVGGTGVLKH